MARNFSSSSIQGMAKRLPSSSEMQDQLLKLLSLALTIPVSSVDCERGFSKKNLIKTKLSLKTANVLTLMKMSVDTPDMENFDFRKAFVMWCSIKDRVMCKS